MPSGFGIASITATNGSAKRTLTCDRRLGTPVVGAIPVPPFAPGNNAEIRCRFFRQHGDKLQQVAIWVVKIDGGCRHPRERDRLCRGVSVEVKSSYSGGARRQSGAARRSSNAAPNAVCRLIL